MSLDNWQKATLALKLLAADPSLGGVVVRARAGPVRDAFIALVQGLNGPVHRIHPNITDEALLGGIDVTATLASGRLVEREGLLGTSGTLILTMGERCPPALAAKLALALDDRPNLTLVVLDEGAEPAEAAPAALIERCAFHVDLSDVAQSDISSGIVLTSMRTIADVPHAALAQATQASAQLGISSLRAPLFTLRAARVLAGLAGRDVVGESDIETAAILTLTHRATQVPQEAPEAETPPEGAETETQQSTQTDLPDELILDAIKAHLPDTLLDQLAQGPTLGGQGNGSGAPRKGNRRGRPLPSRPGRPKDGGRVDLIATLRAAAPWQTIRRANTGRDGIHIRQSDIHTKRYALRSDRVLVFAVDASGSAALARLAEAKGAVELLLSQAYARRDHVSLIAFRGTEAELLLPPTRSLVQTKRRLAGLPGGGGTPLAAGLEEALAQGLLAQRKGLSPTVVVMTDGRANIALDGAPDRVKASADASRMAQALRRHGMSAIVIDTGNRPEPSLRTLAQTLDATYVPLPRADAHRLSAAVSQTLDV